MKNIISKLKELVVAVVTHAAKRTIASLHKLINKLNKEV